MASFPTLSSGSARVNTSLLGEPLAMFPVVVSNGYKTRVLEFLSGKEQTWLVADELASIQLQYSGLNGYDVSVLRTFFHLQKGMYVNTALTNTFDITVKGVNYAYCTFDQDDFSPTVNESETFSLTLKIIQVRRN